MNVSHLSKNTGSAFELENKLSSLKEGTLSWFFSCTKEGSKSIVRNHLTVQNVFTTTHARLAFTVCLFKLCKTKTCPWKKSLQLSNPSIKNSHQAVPRTCLKWSTNAKESCSCSSWPINENGDLFWRSCSRDIRHKIFISVAEGIKVCISYEEFWAIH